MSNEKTELKPWLFELADGSYEVHTKDGIFGMEDVEYDKIDRARKRGEKSGTENKCVLSELIISVNSEKKKLGELEIGKFKSSSVMRMIYVMNEIMGISDFLSKSNEE
jgi:hypothetical protein